MVEQTLVVNGMALRVQKWVRDVSLKKGQFRLAALVQGTDSPATDSWSLELSAPWLDAMGPRVGSEYVAKNLKKALEPRFRRSLLRISVWEASSEYVLRIVRDVHIQAGAPPLVLSNTLLGVAFVTRAVVFVSDPDVPAVKSA